MDHRDHVDLIHRAVVPGGVWADFGSGDGAFTLALAELLGGNGVIYAVDKDGRALKRLADRARRDYAQTAVHTLQHDFSRRLENLPPLDGLLMANSLHFFQDKETIVTLLRSYLKENGHFVVVEYDTNRGNRWVPYPLSFSSWRAFAQRSGFAATELLATRPSRFLGQFYAALSK
jgi:ubiquinone/menaquinone biosynthesis C-methylase UbiE